MVSKTNNKKPWRSEELNDIVGDNIYHDRLEKEKASNTNELRAKVQGILNSELSVVEVAQYAAGNKNAVTQIMVEEFMQLIDRHITEARITELKELALDHYQGKTFSDSTDYKAKFEKFVRNNERRIRELGGRDG